jgi:hypothetical protein
MKARNYAVVRDEVIHGVIETRIGSFQPYFKKEDKLVVFEREPDDVYFIGTAEIIEVEDIRKEQSFFQISHISSLEKFPSVRKLSVLAGSLEKVYRFLEPAKHFKRKIVAISDNDLMTILNNEIDIFRTISRYFFSILPFGAKMDFINENRDVLSLTRQNELCNYNSFAGIILTFFQENIWNGLKKLENLKVVFSQIEGNDMPKLEDLVLSSDENNEKVFLGKTLLEAVTILNKNPFFVQLEGETLFDECRRQLARGQEQSENFKSMDSQHTYFLEELKPRKERLWKDKIF